MHRFTISRDEKDSDDDSVVHVYNLGSFASWKPCPSFPDYLQHDGCNCMPLHCQLWADGDALVPAEKSPSKKNFLSLVFFSVLCTANQTFWENNHKTFTDAQWRQLLKNKNISGDTPITVACLRHNWDALTFFLNHNLIAFNHQMRAYESKTNLMFVISCTSRNSAPYDAAILNNIMTQAQEDNESPAAFMRFVDSYQLTALHHAIRRHNSPLFGRMLSLCTNIRISSYLSAERHTIIQHIFIAWIDLYRSDPPPPGSMPPIITLNPAAPIRPPPDKNAPQYTFWKPSDFKLSVFPATFKIENAKPNFCYPTYYAMYDEGDLLKYFHQICNHYEYSAATLRPWLVRAIPIACQANNRALLEALLNAINTSDTLKPSKQRFLANSPTDDTTKPNTVKAFDINAPLSATSSGNVSDTPLNLALFHHATESLYQILAHPDIDPNKVFQGGKISVMAQLCRSDWPMGISYLLQHRKFQHATIIDDFVNILGAVVRSNTSIDVLKVVLADKRIKCQHPKHEFIPPLYLAIAAGKVDYIWYLLQSARCDPGYVYPPLGSVIQYALVHLPAKLFLNFMSFPSIASLHVTIKSGDPHQLVKANDSIVRQIGHGFLNSAGGYVKAKPPNPAKSGQTAVVAVNTKPIIAPTPSTTTTKTATATTTATTKTATAAAATTNTAAATTTSTTTTKTKTSTTTPAAAAPTTSSSKTASSSSTTALSDYIISSNFSTPQPSLPQKQKPDSAAEFHITMAATNLTPFLPELPQTTTKLSSPLKYIEKFSVNIVINGTPLWKIILDEGDLGIPIIIEHFLSRAEFQVNTIVPSLNGSFVHYIMANYPKTRIIFEHMVQQTIAFFNVSMSRPIAFRDIPAVLCDFTQCDSHSYTPLMLAVVLPPPAQNCIDHLLHVPNVSINQTNSLSRSALHYAVLFGKNAIVKRLLEDHNTDISLLDYTNRSPLAFAAATGNVELVNELMTFIHGNPIKELRVQFTTTLYTHIWHLFHCAYSENHTEVVETLLRYPVIQNALEARCPVFPSSPVSSGICSPPSQSNPTFRSYIVKQEVAMAKFKPLKAGSVTSFRFDKDAIARILHQTVAQGFETNSLDSILAG